MKVDLTKEPNNVVKFDIEIPAKDAALEYNKAVKKISQYVNIPGFRKGKAPRNIVEQHVGVQSIKQEALEACLPNVLRKAIADNKLDVIAQPSLESYEFELGQDLKIVAKVELRPEVKLGEYKNLKHKVEEFNHPKEAFDKSLEDLMQRYTTLNLVVDRKSKDTDVVVMDFDGSVNGEKIQGGEGHDYPLDLAHSNFIPGFAEQLIGHSVGEEFDITVDFPKDYHEAKLAGQPAVFKIKIKEIKEKVLPELTDEFAQKIGPFKTVDDIKADIKKYLDTTKENKNKKNAEKAIFDKILAEVKVDIQDTMIQKEDDSLLEEYKQRISEQGINVEDALKSQDQEELNKELREEAILRVKNSLVIDKIAEEEKITVQPADLEKKLNEIEHSYNLSREDVLKQVKQNPMFFSSLSQQALNEKVIEFLSANNEVTFTSKK